MADDDEVPDLSNLQLADDKKISVSNENNTMADNEPSKLSNAQIAGQNDIQIVTEKEVANSKQLEATNKPLARTMTLSRQTPKFLGMNPTT